MDMIERIKKIVENLSPEDNAVIKAIFGVGELSPMVQKVKELIESLPEDVDITMIFEVGGDTNDAEVMPITEEVPLSE